MTMTAPRPYDLTATTKNLRESAKVAACVTRVLARWVIDTPALEAKILFARHLHDWAQTAAAFAARAAELGHDSNLSVDVAVVQRVSALIGADGCTARMRALYDQFVSDVSRGFQEWRLHTAEVLDEPTARLLDGSIAMLDRQREEAVATRTLLQPEEIAPAVDAEVAHAPSVAWAQYAALLEPPMHPSRDKRFSTEGRTPNPFADNDDAEAIRALLHVNLTDLEIATIEACGRLILESPDLPWEFVTDFARQCWDEARHAEAFRRAFLQLGGTLGEYRVAHSLWQMASGEPLAIKLAIHQRIGEWTGVDGALFHAERLERLGAGDLATLFEFVARDEITHVAFGNKWISYALGGRTDAIDDAIAEAEARRASFGKPSQGPLVFPLNLWACERAGFSESDIRRLEQRFDKFGSVHAIGDPSQPRG